MTSGVRMKMTRKDVSGFLLGTATGSMLAGKLLSLVTRSPLYRKMFNEAAIGFVQISFDGRIISLNESMARIVGQSAKDLVGVHLRDLTHPDDVSTTLENLSRLARGEVNNYVF